MEGNSLSNPIKAFVRQARWIASKHVSLYTNKYSKKVFTQPQLIAINLLRIRWGWTYRETEHFLEVMDSIQHELDLKRVPDHSTVQNAYDRISCWLLRLILKQTANHLESSGILAVDATGFQRRWSSRHYTKRTGMKLKALKVTVLADVGNVPFVRDVHVTTTRLHDTKILPKLIPKNAAGAMLVGDKGYDDDAIRRQCQKQDLQPLIKHREYGPKDVEANEELDEAGYNHRQKIESLFSSVKRTIGDEVSSRTWYRQFRDIIARMVVHNLNQIVGQLSLWLFYELTGDPTLTSRNSRI